MVRMHGNTPNFNASHLSCLTYEGYLANLLSFIKRENPDQLVNLWNIHTCHTRHMLQSFFTSSKSLARPTTARASQATRDVSFIFKR